MATTTDAGKSIPPTTITNEITLSTRAGRPTIWIEVVYDGTNPPRALFADLGTIGFEPPTEMPPPSAAMDWSTPDPATGRDFTIRPHRVEWTIEPPLGTGYKQSWTKDERAVYEQSLLGVLRRHGLADLRVGGSAAIPDPNRLEALPPPPPPPPVPVPVHEPDRAGSTLHADTVPAPFAASQARDDEDDVVGFHMATAPTPPPPAETSPAATAPGTKWHRITIASLGARLADVRRALQGAGMAAKVSRHEEEVEQRYRGSVHVSIRIVERLTVICDDAQLVVLEPTIEAADVDLRMISIDSSPARPSDLAEFLAIDADAGSSLDRGRTEPSRPSQLAEPSSGSATVRAVFDPRRQGVVDEALDELCIEDRTYSAARREVVSRYRGSEHRTEAPAVALMVDVDPAMVGAVVATLVRVAAIDASDDAQLQVHATAPPISASQPPAEATLRLVG